MSVTILYRPVGPAEMALIEAGGFRSFPPRLPEQPIVYPVMNEGYAREIAQGWNVRESGFGAVTRFAIDTSWVSRFAVQTVGAARHQELWVPADQLELFNEHLVGPIEVIATFTAVDQKA